MLAAHRETEGTKSLQHLQLATVLHVLPSVVTRQSVSKQAASPGPKHFPCNGRKHAHNMLTVTEYGHQHTWYACRVMILAHRGSKQPVYTYLLSEELHHAAACATLTLTLTLTLKMNSSSRKIIAHCSYTNPKYDTVILACQA